MAQLEAVDLTLIAVFCPADAAQSLYREMAKNLNESSVLEAPANARFDASELTVEDRFQRGWVTFSDKLCQLDLGHDFNDSRTLWLNATTALGHVFGSTKTACNEDLSSLDGLMSHLTSAECDPFVRTMGLRCCRSILYIQPDNDEFSDSERYYHLRFRPDFSDSGMLYVRRGGSRNRPDLRD
jgi:hypothetical protein